MTNPMNMGAKAQKDETKDHWQTPRYILDLVDKFYDGNWFDPCPANPTFDGLSIDWDDHDNVFINPPFSQYKRWVDHGTYFDNHQVWICHTNNSSGWFKDLLSCATGVILIDHRVKFIEPATGLPSKSTAIGKSQALLYCGWRSDDFLEIFRPLGCPLEVKCDCF